jgi:hypothetical protein
MSTYLTGRTNGWTRSEFHFDGRLKGVCFRNLNIERRLCIYPCASAWNEESADVAMAAGWEATEQGQQKKRHG